MNATPISLRLETAFQTQLKQLQDNWNLVFRLAPKNVEESFVQSVLRLTAWYEQEEGNRSEIDQAVEEIRRAGRFCLSYVSINHICFRKWNDSFMSRRFCELMSVYLFTAPLEALHWKIMHAPQFDDVNFTDWNVVAGLNEAAGNIQHKILKKYICIWAMMCLNVPGDNPHPLADVVEIATSILHSTPPQSIAGNVEKVRSYFEM